MLKRKVLHSRESCIILDEKEKLGTLMKIEQQTKYLFLRYEENNILKILIYDYDSDSRVEIGHIKSGFNLKPNRNTKVRPELLYISTMPKKLRIKMEKFINTFRRSFYRTYKYIPSRSYSGTSSPSGSQKS